MTDRDVLHAFRATWWGAWIAFMMTDDVTILTIPACTALACAIACAALLANKHAVCVVVVVVSIVALREVAIAAVPSSLWFAWAMSRSRFRAARLAFHLASFFGTFAIALPLLSSSTIPSFVPLDPELFQQQVIGDARFSIALLLLIPGTVLMAVATSTLIADGGTPDPCDPPHAHQTRGIYSVMRHPIQLAEILIVASASIMLGTLGALSYLALFTLLLIGPVRMLEERALPRS